MKRQHKVVVPTDAAQQIAREVRSEVEHALGIFVRAPAFGARIETFAATLAIWGSRSNLTARPHDPGEVAFHVVDSVMPIVIAGGDDPGPLADAFVERRRILDVGSGAGFPGLILAAACEADFTLVEARRKRASFIDFAIAEMGLPNARVEHTRTNTSEMRAQYGLVVTRALGVADFFALAHAALKPGGFALQYASEAQTLEHELAATTGFDACVEKKYSLNHNGRRANRVLAVWRKTKL